MEEKIKALLEQIGRPYEMFNKDGTYQGCFYPLQFFISGYKTLQTPYKNYEKNYIYGMAKIKNFLKKYIPENCNPET